MEDRSWKIAVLEVGSQSLMEDRSWKIAVLEVGSQSLMEVKVGMALMGHHTLYSVLEAPTCTLYYLHMYMHQIQPIINGKLQRGVPNHRGVSYHCDTLLSPVQMVPGGTISLVIWYQGVKIQVHVALISATT